MKSLALYHEMAATRSTRTRSSNRVNAPKYTFDDDEEEDEEDEFAMYRRPSSRNSRRRLNDPQEQDDQHEGLGESLADEHHEEDGDHEHSHSSTLDHKERELSASSSRSSVGRDSDTSIRVAFERTKMQDGEEDSGNEYTTQVSAKAPELASASYHHAVQENPHNIATEVLPTAVVHTIPDASPLPVASPLPASDVIPAVSVGPASMASTLQPSSESMEVDQDSH